MNEENEDLAIFLANERAKKLEFPLYILGSNDWENFKKFL